MVQYRRLTGAESEEIVAELVYGFLLPEVQKQTVRDKGKHYFVQLWWLQSMNKKIVLWFYHEGRSFETCYNTA